MSRANKTSLRSSRSRTRGSTRPQDEKFVLGPGFEMRQDMRYPNLLGWYILWTDWRRKVRASKLKSFQLQLLALSIIPTAIILISPAEYLGNPLSVCVFSFEAGLLLVLYVVHGLRASWDTVDLMELTECADAMAHGGDYWRDPCARFTEYSIIVLLATSYLMWKLWDYASRVNPAAAIAVKVIYTLYLPFYIANLVMPTFCSRWPPTTPSARFFPHVIRRILTFLDSTPLCSCSAWVRDHIPLLNPEAGVAHRGRFLRFFAASLRGEVPTIYKLMEDLKL